MTPGATVTAGAGTATVTLSVGSATPSGVITFSPWSPTTAVTGTYSSGGAAAGVVSVTLTAATPANINGWYVSGTSLTPGTIVASGQGTATITFYPACTGVMSGTYTFYPPTMGPAQMIYTVTAAPVVTTGLAAGANNVITSGLGSSATALVALAASPVAGISRYVIAKREVIGSTVENAYTNYNSGVSTAAGSTTTIIDSSAFLSIPATNSGAAFTNTITLSTAAPANSTGWIVSGTGVALGAKITGGAGTTTITVDLPNTATVSGIIILSAWNLGLVNHRIRLLSGTGAIQESVITAVTPTTGTLTFTAVTTAPAISTTYSLIGAPIRSTGHEMQWFSGTSNAALRGKYLVCARGGATVGFDKLNITTDRWTQIYSIPVFETLTTGSMYAYDGQDRFYFTKEVTLRVYYLDINTGIIHGAGMMPYVAGTATLGNRLEIITTVDGLKYMWTNRQQFTECFRQLMFY